MRSSIDCGNLSKNFKIYTFLIGICLYLFFATWKLNIPGPYYDELLFVDTATSFDPSLFIYKSFLGIPILLMSYIGALKAWIYAPIFNLLGVSIYSIRLPMILLGLGTLSIYFFILQKLVRQKLLFFCSFLLLCTDPAFSFVSRIDWGPNAIAHFLIALLFWQFLRYLKYGSPWMLLSIVITALLGVFEKLNFLWFLNGLLFAGFFCYRRELWGKFKLNKRPTVLILCLAMIIAIWLMIVWIIPASQALEADKPFTLLDKANNTYHQLRLVLSSESIYSMVFASSYPYAIQMILPVLLGVSILTLLIRKNEMIVLARFSLLISICILVQIWLTRSAGGPHHLLLIWPLIWLVIILNSSAIICSYSYLRSPIYLIIFILLIGNILHGSYFITQINLANSWRPSWSPAIYKLIEDLEQDPAEEIFCLDWGLATSIKALANLPVRTNIHDIWPSFWNKPKISRARNLRNLIKSKNSDLTKIRLVEFIPSQAVRPQVHRNLKKLLKSLKHYQAEVSLVQLNGYGYLVYNFKERMESPILTKPR